MFAQMRIAFKALYNHIKNIRTNTEVGLSESNKIFTIIGIDPYTILKVDESIFLHKPPQSYSHASAPFGNIKDDHTPTAVPPSLFRMSNFLYF